MTVIKKCQANGPSTRQHRSMREGIVKLVNEMKIALQIVDSRTHFNIYPQNNYHDDIDRAPVVL